MSSDGGHLEVGEGCPDKVYKGTREPHNPWEKNVPDRSGVLILINWFY